MNEALLKDIVDGIKELADELLTKKDLDLLDRGELLAYAEVLCIIQDVVGNERLPSLGLDFDVDKKYLLP